MKAKYIIIGLLIVLLGFTVIKMIQFERSIREEKIITLVFEDNSGPLISDIPEEELRSVSLGSEYYFISNGNYLSTL